MTINEYQVQAMRFANPKCLNIFNAALGLNGEAGEFADLVKKINFHGHTQDNDHLIKELGDALWYIALAAQILGIDLERLCRKTSTNSLQGIQTGLMKNAAKTGQKMIFK